MEVFNLNEDGSDLVLEDNPEPGTLKKEESRKQILFNIALRNKGKHGLRLVKLLLSEKKHERY